MRRTTCRTCAAPITQPEGRGRPRVYCGMTCRNVAAHLLDDVRGYPETSSAHHWRERLFGLRGDRPVPDDDLGPMVSL